jgi:hypothetical protein
MNGVRLLGVKFIAIYLFLKAAALILAVFIINTRPDLRQGANEFITYFSINIGITLPYLAVILNVTLGLGILFQQRWSRTIIVCINSYYFFKLIFGSVIRMQLEPKRFSSEISSPYFIVSCVASLIILCYLLDPDVKRAFGERG